MITLRQYEMGEAIVKENDAGETAYIIERGRVEVAKGLDGGTVHLAYLGAGQTFGEMAVIDDKPRSATVTAVEETVVREIHRDGFFRSLQTDPEVALNLLRALFERLREANATILRLQRPGERPPQAPAAPPPKGSVDADAVVFLEGLTPQAVRVLPANPFQVMKLPFRIGRQSHDPLVDNDLMILDSAPLQISRHHVAVVQQGGRIGVADRGSRLGSLVDGRQLGGANGDPGPLFFAGPEGLLVLGNGQSSYRYKVVIKAGP